MTDVVATLIGKARVHIAVGSGKVQISSPLYWTFPDPTAMWTRALPIRVATTSVINTRCVSCFSAQEVLKSSFRSRRDRSNSTRARSDLSRAPNQDFGSERTCHPKKSYQVL